MLRAVTLLPRLPSPISNSRIFRCKMSATPGPICPKFIALEDGEDATRIFVDGGKLVPKQS